MMNLMVLGTVASPENWSIKVGLIMITCNVFAFLIGRYAIQQKGVGPILPLPLPDVMDKFGVPELLATLSFGHILGAGMILGMRASGLL